MPQPPADPALQLFQIGTLMLSIVACMNVILMRRNGPVLPYEPRRPVPWGAFGSILAVLFVINTIASALMGGASDDANGSSHPLTPLTLINGMFAELIIVGAFLVVIALFTKATPKDLGLPTNYRQAIRDVCIGGAACLAALAPVLMLQQALMHFCFPEQMESGHPLIKTVLNEPPDRGVLFLAGVFAVVVAPICEEVTFRLLLQGCLERWEDKRLGWRKRSAGEMPIDQIESTSEGTPLAGNEPAQPSVPLTILDEPCLESEPPCRGVAGMPYGLLPILISSIAFGAAHFGYGPEPVPLFLLALVLGYLYQRTHRIVPGIVAHSLFNLFTMIILWQMVYRRN